MDTVISVLPRDWTKFVQNIDQWHLQLQPMVWALLCAGCVACYLFLARKTSTSIMPVYKASFDVVKALEQGHAENPESPFLLSLPGMDMVILPQSSIDIIKALPEDQVSIKKHHHDVFLGEYTFMGTKADEFDAAMRYDLTRNTPTVLASFTAEVDYAVQDSLGNCDIWKPVKARQTMSRIASLMSGRAFVGLPLSRDEDWVNATVNYTQDVTRAWMILFMLPKLLRPVIAPFLPQVRSLKGHREMTKKKLASQLKKLSSEPKVDKEAGGDMIRWFQGQYKSKATASDLTRDQLLATFASIYNLSNALTYLLFDLAGHPEHIGPLRAELESVVPGNTVIDKNSIQKLVKLDSFIRESQRLCPPSIANMPRIVTNPGGLQLPTGQKLAYGARIMVRANPINLNPKTWEDPEKFDGFRFSRLRSHPGSEFKYQHTTTGTDNINFGHGIWACPGRHFASAQMKVVMAYLLRNYDFKLEGQEKPKQQHFGLAIIPDAEANVMIRRRRNSEKA